MQKNQEQIVIQKPKRINLFVVSLAAIIAILLSYNNCGQQPENSIPQPSNSQSYLRSFSMGFTNWPYGNSTKAVDETYRRIAENADLLAFHFDNGIPWTEALTDTDLNKNISQVYKTNLINEWTSNKTKRDSLPLLQLLVSVTPLDINRTNLAKYWGPDGGNQTLPPPWNTYTFDTPQVKSAYLNYCKRVVNFFNPTYFAIAIEANLLMNTSKDKWLQFISLIKSTQAGLKAAYPSLPILITMTGVDLLEGYSDLNHTDQLAAIHDLMPYTDYFTVSLYPYMSSFLTNTLPTSMLSDLQKIADSFGKPIAISESGYPAQSFSIANGTADSLAFNSSEQKQEEYMLWLLQEADKNQFKFIVQYAVQDFDELWKTFDPATQAIAMIWRDTGLISETGHNRAALGIWQSYLRRKHTLGTGSLNSVH